MLSALFFEALRPSGARAPCGLCGLGGLAGVDELAGLVGLVGLDGSEPDSPVSCEKRSSFIQNLARITPMHDFKNETRPTMQA